MITLKENAPLKKFLKQNKDILNKISVEQLQNIMKILNDGSIPDGIEEGAEGEALKSSINNLIEDKVVEVAAPAGVPTQQPPINEEKVDDELNDEEAEEV